MSAYTRDDINHMSWQEFDVLIDALVSKITQKIGGVESVHVIAPLLRTGGIVGGVLAAKMNVIPMLPIQFKYSYNPTNITQIITVPDLLTTLPENMNIVLAEGNTSSGSIAKKAAQVIKEKYPDVRIYLATLTKVYGGFENLDGIEKVFYGTMTNENRKATPEEAQGLDLRPGITVFPWEDPERELNDLNAIS